MTALLSALGAVFVALTGVLAWGLSGPRWTSSPWAVAVPLAWFAVGAVLALS